MKRTWKPTVAGILDIILGVGLLGGLIAEYFEYESLLVFVWLPLVILPLVGSVYALRRRIWWRALVGSILALPPIDLVPFILIVLSKEEFTRPS